MYKKPVTGSYYECSVKWTNKFIEPPSMIWQYKRQMRLLLFTLCPATRFAMHRKTNLLVQCTRSSVCCANLILGFCVNFVHTKHLAEYYLWTVAPLSPASFRHLTPLRHVPKSCTAKTRTLPPAKCLRDSIVNLFPCWNLPGIRVWTSYVCRNLYTFSQIMYQTSCISEMILRGLIAALPVSNSTI